jgi:hypothetical protein
MLRMGPGHTSLDASTRRPKNSYTAAGLNPGENTSLKSKVNRQWRLHLLHASGRSQLRWPRPWKMRGAGMGVTHRCPAQPANRDRLRAAPQPCPPLLCRPASLLYFKYLSFFLSLFLYQQYYQRRVEGGANNAHRRVNTDILHSSISALGTSKCSRPKKGKARRRQGQEATTHPPK